MAGMACHSPSFCAIRKPQKPFRDGNRKPSDGLDVTATPLQFAELTQDLSAHTDVLTVFPQVQSEVIRVHPWAPSPESPGPSSPTPDTADVQVVGLERANSAASQIAAAARGRQSRRALAQHHASAAIVQVRMPQFRISRGAPNARCMALIIGCPSFPAGMCSFLPARAEVLCFYRGVCSPEALAPHDRRRHTPRQREGVALVCVCVRFQQARCGLPAPGF